jgi:hypothetical protein
MISNDPLDLDAVRRTDELINELSTYECTGDSRCCVAAVLLAWRKDIRAEPVGQLVDVPTALAVIKASSRHRWWRWPWIRGQRAQHRI